MGRKKFNMDPKKVREKKPPPQQLYSCSVFSLSVRCVLTDSSSSLQGIVFLVENELLRHTSEDIAQFLYKGEGLNKTAIGDYLGERCRVMKYLLFSFSLHISPLFNCDLSVAAVLQRRLQHQSSSGFR